MEMCGVGGPEVEDLAPKWRCVGLGVNGMTPKREIWSQNGRFGPKMEVFGVGCQWDDPKVGDLDPKMEVFGVGCQWDDLKVGDLAPKWRSVGLGVNGMTLKWEIWPQNGGLWG